VSIATREWYVRCRDSRMPQTPLTLADAKAQARKCDRLSPDCAPHEVHQGRPAENNNYE
jgi:hypothetical protein